MDKDFLKKLMSTNSPSGYEDEAVKVFNEYCKSLGAKHEFTDFMGNSCYSIGTGNTKVMISAHIDELGYQVQNITEDGMIQFVRLGGIDKKTLPGSIVYFPRTDIIGVIGKKPIHLEESEERGKVEQLKDLLVDIGAENKEDAEKIVKIGDFFLPQTGNSIQDLGKNKFTCKGLDDKIGVYIVSQILEKLISVDSIKEKYTFYFVANTQEEVGLRGATVTSKRINPDISIDLDVTFATDEGRGISIAEEGNVKLGNGPVIQHGPDKNKKLNAFLENIAERFKVPYQSICSGAGGTNTAAIQEGSLNCMTTLISIPLRNMHTPVEVCDYRDIKNTIDLIGLGLISLKEFEYEC